MTVYPVTFQALINIPNQTISGTVLASGGDDLAAINAALEEFAEVVLPSPVYKVSGPIVARSNTWLRLGHNTVVRPLLDTGHSHHLLVNYRATQTTGPLDENIRVSGGIWDGLSTGYTDDNRRGYGMEFYGVDGLHVHDVRLRNIPLSALEVCGDYAAIANGVRDGTPPLKCTDVILERIKFKHVGWQEQHLNGTEERELLWGDAGFGVIARAPARNVTMRDITGRDVQFGIAGVGQLCNLNDSAKTGDNLAQVIGALLSNIHADQTGFPALAPSIRTAFCRNVTVENSRAFGNAASQGFAARQAGSTPVQKVCFDSCHSEGNDYGLIANGASSSVFTEDVSVTGGHYQANTTDGVLIEDFGVSVVGVTATGNGRHGINVNAAASQDTRARISGNMARDNGVTGRGIRLNNVTRCTVTGNNADTIEEFGAANFNVLTSNSASVTKLGANSVAANNV
jgi:hypothetical protein